MSAVPHESLTNHGWLLTSNEILPGDLALTIWIEALDPCLGQHRKPDEGPRDDEETVHHDLSAVQVTRSTDPSFLVRNFFTMALAMIEAFLLKRMCAIWLDEKRSLAKAREPTLPRLVVVRRSCGTCSASVTSLCDGRAAGALHHCSEPTMVQVSTLARRCTHANRSMLPFTARVSRHEQITLPVALSHFFLTSLLRRQLQLTGTHLSCRSRI